jgi:predicted AAA+ superfamily ATPase
VSLYVREEVQVEGVVRRLGDFARFLEVVSFSHGQVLNVSNVARECQTERTTVAGFVQILEDLLLAFRLPVFAKRAQRAVTVHPKFYYCDAGVFRSLRPTGPLDRASEVDGGALEGLVAQHLRAWVAYSGDCCRLYFWRTRAGSEVDFVVYGDAGFWAVEVKNAGSFQRSDLQSLRSLVTDYPECRPIFLYRGTDSLLVDGVVCLPIDRFLSDLVPNRPLLPA